MLVTVVSTKGSTPRESGTKMIVSMDRIQGTIGGGNLEYQCIDIARQRLSRVPCHAWRRHTHRFPLGASLGQCCGGVVNVFFELITPADTAWIHQLDVNIANHGSTVVITSLDDNLSEKRLISSNEIPQDKFLEGGFALSCSSIADQLLKHGYAHEPKNIEFSFGELNQQFLAEAIIPNDFHLMIFGAGHVGKSLVNVLSGVECTITWVDSREEQYPELIPHNTIAQLEDEPEDAVLKAPDNTYFIVMTHCHQLDLRICSNILQRKKFSYCGLIGSQSKRRKFEKRLHTKGFSKEVFSQITCPMGISGINSKKPGEIAIAISAEILQLRNRSLEHRESNRSADYQLTDLIHAW